MQLSDLDWKAVLAVLPALGVIGKGVVAAVAPRSFGNQARRHIELLKQLPDGIEAPRLRQVVNEELDAIADNAEFRFHRVFDWRQLGKQVAWALFAAAVVFSAFVFTGEGAPSAWDRIWQLLAILMALAVALALVKERRDFWKDTRTDPKHHSSAESVATPEDTAKPSA
jgi:hypothetical protein